MISCNLFKTKLIFSYPLEAKNPSHIFLIAWYFVANQIRPFMRVFYGRRVLLNRLHSEYSDIFRIELPCSAPITEKGEIASGRWVS